MVAAAGLAGATVVAPPAALAVGDGTLDPTFNPPTFECSVSGVCSYAAVGNVMPTSSGLVVSGRFVDVGGDPARDMLVRLNPTTGALDTTFNPPTFNRQAAAVLPTDQGLLVGGYFTDVGGDTARDNLVRLNTTTGALDTTFNPPSTNGSIGVLAETGAGLLVGGASIDIGGDSSRNKLVRLDPTTGVLDTTFNPPFTNSAGFGGNVLGLATTDHGLVVGGSFTNVGGDPDRDMLVRLNTITGAMDTTFNPPVFDAWIGRGIAPTDDGLLVGGWFTDVGGDPDRDHLVRLDDSSGALDTTFAPPTFNARVTGAVMPTEAGLFIGGAFTDVDGDPARTALVRLKSFPTPVTPPTPTPTPTPTPVTPPADATEVAVTARAKAKQLKPRKRTKIVRSVSTNAQITKVMTNCYLYGTRLRGEDKRAVCNFKKRKTNSNAKIWVKPRCSVGLKVRVKIVVNASGMDKATWQRTWKVKNSPRTYCRITGNG
jgi:hypothetical protein